MESLWDIIYGALVKFFTDPALLSAVSGIVAITITAAVKSTRDWIIRECKKLSKHLTRRKVHINSDLTGRLFDITNELAILRASIKASRVSVYQFHNGDKFTLSDPIFKMTCSHENVSHGLVPDSQYVKFVLVSTVLNFIAPLMDRRRTPKGVYDLEVGEGMPRVVKYKVREMDYDWFHHTMFVQGTNTAYAVLLYASDRKSPVGILCIQYTAPPDAQSDKLLLDNMENLRSTVCQLEFGLDEDLI